MDNNFAQTELELITVIVKCGLGSKVLKTAKKCGVRGGTILIGKGTVKNWILEFLEIQDTRREIVLMGCRKDVSENALAELNRVMQLQKPNHGIAYCTDILGIYGSKGEVLRDEPYELKSEDSNMYTQIMIIVDKGKAEDVMEAAISAGSRGGTIINARGSGIHETSMLFSMEIEPEKEIVLILAKNDTVEAIISKVSESQKISEPGNGIIFTQPVSRTYGIVE